ncbi:hypothetical protein J3R83DRAFT_13709 [Lanmaoa asiatica]|nr:hypothetical protein J3R83DRAFT_13709 [Lanmaoa asiatica]
MKNAAMFPAFRNGVVGEKLLTAEQVLISDWESRDFGGNVFVAPENDILQKMYREMGSEFLGRYVQHDVFPVGQKADGDLPFNGDQVIWRIRCLMKQRDKSGRTDVSFDGQGATSNLRVRACKSLTLKKTFTPPFGILEETECFQETEPVQIKAGLSSDEDDESYTLWMVGGSSDSELVALRNDIAVALCHVLFKTYGPNDVLLLTSLFVMDDERLVRYYGSEIKSELPSDPDAKNIKYFTCFLLPNDLSPPDTIYIDVTQGVSTRNSVERVVQRLALNEDSGQDMGYRILRVLVQFALVEGMSSEQWDRAAELVKELECIPTNMGPKLPVDSYFEDADNISRNLPIATETIFLDIPATPVAVERNF